MKGLIASKFTAAASTIATIRFASYRQRRSQFPHQPKRTANSYFVSAATAEEGRRSKKSTRVRRRREISSQLPDHKGIRVEAVKREAAALRMAPSKETLKACYEDCTELVKAKHCAPLLVRFAWHDSGNYDKNFGTGGANGSIRFSKELAHGGNAGLTNALSLLEPIKKKYSDISYADLFQMASAAAIKASGGPDIPMRYGRVDVKSEEDVPKEGRLPDGAAPFGQSDGENPGEKSKDPSPSAHLRRVFYRMGLSDKEIVALSGAHALGRAYKDRSGLVTMVDTKYTREGPGNKGGMSWTKNFLQFDNSYFVLLKEAQEGQADPELLRLVTDTVLLEDEKFKPFAQKYASDQEAFFRDYAEAHAKLSECGSTFDPPSGIKIDV